MDMKERFTYVYDNNIWGGSGGGSDYSLLGDFFYWINQFIKDNNIKTMLDYGCGLNPVGSVIHIEKYIGVDVVESVVKHCQKNYSTLDIRITEHKNLPNADLILIKDVFIHWSIEEINNFIWSIIDKYKYIVLVNSCNQTEDNPNNPLPHLQANGLSYKFEPLKLYKPELILMLTKNQNDPKEVLLIENK